MEGTLSLFDWRPEPPGPVGTVAEGSGPCAQVEPDVHGTDRGLDRGLDRGPGDLAGAGERDGAGRAGGVPEVGAAGAAGAAGGAPELSAVAGALEVGAVGDGVGHRPRIVIFDCETTGTDRSADQVIELCIQRGLSERAPRQTWRIKPSVPIHPGAQAVHGITLADLAGCPAFAEVADDIAAVFTETDVIVGYNIAFDIDMLQAEYTRIGKPMLDFAGKKIVDAFRLWQQCEPRSLQHAHQRFVGNGFDAAHSASADVAATGRVLAGMLRAFNLTDHDWDAIATRCDPQQGARASWVGPSRHLRWEDDVVVLGFGKYANVPIHELAAGPDRNFLRWVVERDFPVHVSEICRAALDLPRDEFLAWARRRFPVPAAAPPSPPPSPPQPGGAVRGP